MPVTLDDHSSSDGSYREPELMLPQWRRTMLDIEIMALESKGYRVEMRSAHHVVMRWGLGGRRMEIFIDEFGEALRS